MNIELFVTPDQREIVTCRAKKIGLFACRRYGKTDTFFNRCLTRSFEAPTEYVYISPDYGLAKEQYERICYSIPGLISRNVGQPKPRIELINGSRIHFRSFDNPKRLRGLRRIGEIFVDEIQDIKEKEFWPVLRPMLADVHGTLMVAGQFRRMNWYYKSFYEEGQIPGQDFCKSWRKPWREAFIYQSAAGLEEVERIRKDMTKAQFQVEMDCLPIGDESGVFLLEDLNACKRGSVQSSPENGSLYIIGYDLGEMKDPSALVVLDYGKNQVVHAETIPLRQKHSMQAETLAKKARFWNNAQVVIDGTGGATGGRKGVDENVKHYRKFIPDVRVLSWQAGFKQELVRELSLEIEDHKISIPAELEELQNELAGFEFKKRAGESEEYIYFGSDGKDHQVAGLMMCVHARRCQWVKGRSGGLGGLLG